MLNKRLLFISTGILLVTTFIVGMFGVVPLPEYDSITEDSNFEGKVIYHVEVQTKNIIPPAPDILDSCIFYIDLSEKPIEEKKIICNSDLYGYSAIYIFMMLKYIKKTAFFLDTGIHDLIMNKKPYW